MRLLVLGATGMLGHKVVQSFGEPFDVFATIRRTPDSLRRFGFYCPDRLVSGVDVMDFATVEHAIDQVKPDAVLNCVGVIKQHALAKDPVTSITINSLLPHRLGNLAKDRGFRFIHISTDCVFDGLKGGYTEDDLTNAQDLYGRSKAMGEVHENGLTLRTSIIGRELETSSGLVDWFLSNRGGEVKGFRQAIFSGFTTNALAGILQDVLLRQPALTGLYQVSAEPIDKDTLLRICNDSFDAKIEIKPDDSIRIDRSLDSTRFRQATGFVPPTWPEMVEEMATDLSPYSQWRSHVSA